MTWLFSLAFFDCASWFSPVLAMRFSLHGTPMRVRVSNESCCHWRAPHAGGSLSAELFLTKEGLSQFGASLPALHLEVAPFPLGNQDILRLTITDPANSRWRVPASILPNLYPPNHPPTSKSRTKRPEHGLTSSTSSPGSLQYSIGPAGEPLRFTVFRTNPCSQPHSASQDAPAAKAADSDSPANGRLHDSDSPVPAVKACLNGTPPSAAAAGSALFELSGFAFKDQYLEIATATPRSSRLIGLAEQSRTTGAPAAARACAHHAPDAMKLYM